MDEPGDRARRPRKAMILAAGKGVRLRPLTESIPKCMVPVAGKPVLEHALIRLRRFGIEEAVINLSHLPDVVMRYFGDGTRFGVHIVYSVEPEPLGTAGGVKHAEARFDGPFFVWYGDNLSTCDLERFFAFHAARGGVASVALFQREDPTASGIAAVDDHDRIVHFQERPAPGEVFSRWVNAGIYILEPAVLEAIPAQGAPDFGRDVFPALLARGMPVYGYQMSPDEGLWWIDTPDDLQRVTAIGWEA